MPSSYTLGPHYEDFVQSQLKGGSYSTASEVVRAGLRLLEERDARLRSLDLLLAEGLDDADNGRTRPAGRAFDALEARLRPATAKTRR